MSTDGLVSRLRASRSPTRRQSTIQRRVLPSHPFIRLHRRSKASQGASLGRSFPNGSNSRVRRSRPNAPEPKGSESVRKLGSPSRTRTRPRTQHRAEGLASGRRRAGRPNLAPQASPRRERPIARPGRSHRRRSATRSGQVEPAGQLREGRACGFEVGEQPRSIATGQPLYRNRLFHAESELRPVLVLNHWSQLHKLAA